LKRPELTANAAAGPEAEAILLNVFPEVAIFATTATKKVTLLETANPGEFLPTMVDASFVMRRVTRKLTVHSVEAGQTQGAQRGDRVPGADATRDLTLALFQEERGATLTQGVTPLTERESAVAPTHKATVHAVGRPGRIETNPNRREGILAPRVLMKNK
jgi:hypothetical protein